MNVVKFIGVILTGIGAILIGIIGIVLLTGGSVVEWFNGISLLVLGVGLFIASLYAICQKEKKETKSD